MKFRIADSIKYFFKANFIKAWLVFRQSKVLYSSLILLRSFGGYSIILNNNVFLISLQLNRYLWEKDTNIHLRTSENNNR
jgi:hypothetical protein